MLKDTVASGKPERQEFRSGSLVVRDKTMIIGNTVYSVSNISTMTVVDATSNRPFPVAALIFGTLGFGLLLAPGAPTKVAAVLALGLAIVIVVTWMDKRTDFKFILSVQMNSGASAGFFSDSKQFLQSIAMALFQSLERDEPRHVTFNLDKRVAIDNVSGSAISIGAVGGDLINRVQKVPAHA
jgi:hypothetical protein